MAPLNKLVLALIVSAVPALGGTITATTFSATTVTLSSLALTNGLVAFYRFDESSGDAADSSGNSKTLSNVNTVTYATGKINNAANLELDSDQRLQRSDSAFSQGGDFTVSLWVNPESAGDLDGADLVSYNTGEQEGDWMVTQSGNQILLMERATGGSWTGNNTPASSLPNSTWTHVVCRRSSGTITVWINGSSASLSGGGQTTGWGNTSFRVGIAYDAQPTWNYDGLVDLLGVWSRALNDAEIGQLYNGGSGSDPTP